jgi:hypothetical protein
VTSTGSSCFIAGTTGVLAVDPVYGTSVDGTPVAWPKGFSARADGEVAVLDPSGTVG